MIYAIQEPAIHIASVFLQPAQDHRTAASAVPGSFLDDPRPVTLSMAIFSLNLMAMILAESCMGFFVLINHRPSSHHCNPGLSDIDSFEIIEFMLRSFKPDSPRSLDGYLLEVGETMAAGDFLPPRIAQLEPALLQPSSSLYN